MSTQLRNMRKNVRANLNVQVLLTGTDREGLPFSISGKSMDFSRKGMGVLLDRDVAGPGTVLTVASDNRFLSSATVQWVRRDEETGLYKMGLRLIEPKASFLFKIAASLLLFWAFMQQVSWASPGEFVRGAPRPSSGVRIEQTVASSTGGAGVSTKEVEQLLGYSDSQSQDQKLEDDEQDGDTWLRAAIQTASEKNTTAGRAALNIRMSKDSYAAGETIAASEYRLSNPSQHSRSVEIKTWLAAPGLPPISVGNVGADGLYVLPPGVSEEYGPVQLMSVADDLPAGKYEFSARMLDPVTGDVLEEKIKPFALSTSIGKPLAKSAAEAPMLDINLQFPQYNYTYGDTVSLAQFRIANPTAAIATLELKVWLEVPGKGPISVFTMGADGSLILTPGSDLNLEPLKAFKVTDDLPAGTYQLKCRAMDPATGQTFFENASSFEIR